MLDVAWCFRRIVECDRVNGALRATAGRALSPRDLDRLAVFAYLHDLGKANAGFQGKYWSAGEVPPGWPASHGHGVEALLTFENGVLSDLSFDEIAAQWGADAGWALVRASLSHHGGPLPEPVNLDSRIWQPVRASTAGPSYDPAHTLRQIGEQVQEVFRQAFEPGGAQLPDAPAFVHLFAGLVQLADWLGSDERFFPYSEAGEHRPSTAPDMARKAVDAIGLDVHRLRGQLRAEAPSFASAFGMSEPRPVRRALGDTELGPLLILESETGSGKTEAALWGRRCARTGRGTGADRAERASLSARLARAPDAWLQRARASRSTQHPRRSRAGRFSRRGRKGGQDGRAYQRDPRSCVPPVARAAIRRARRGSRRRCADDRVSARRVDTAHAGHGTVDGRTHEALRLRSRCDVRGGCANRRPAGVRGSRRARGRAASGVWFRHAAAQTGVRFEVAGC